MTADIYKQIADEHYKLADLYSQLASDTATTPAPASSAPSFDELPPDVYQGEVPAAYDLPPDGVPRNSQQDTVLGECPVHFRAWTVKEGGISKNGKSYTAFWKCNGKNDDGSYCNKKPTPGWVKTHDPEKALAAA